MNMKADASCGRPTKRGTLTSVVDVVRMIEFGDSWIGWDGREVGAGVFPCVLDDNDMKMGGSDGEGGGGGEGIRKDGYFHV